LSKSHLANRIKAQSGAGHPRWKPIGAEYIDNNGYVWVD